jgi:hypothetical protein
MTPTEFFNAPECPRCRCRLCECDTPMPPDQMRPAELLNTLPAAKIQAALDRHGSVVHANGCIHFGGFLRPSGHGLLSIGSVRFSAHRAAWVAKNGPMDPAMYACHSCDNPWCINPDHIFPGTPSDNMQDCSQKKRLHAHVSPETLFQNRELKLTDADVCEIREMWATGEWTQKELGRFFNIDKSYVQKIVSNKTKTAIRARVK